MRAGLALLALAALCAAAAGRELSTSPAGRDLLQVSGTDCSRSVPNCDTCRFQFFRGTTTRAICTACTTGFKPAAMGRACWCAAGYYKDGSACTACGTGNYCPGARSTEASATQTACGANMNTLSNRATSIRECFVNAGYGWNGAASVQCTKGTFNPGNNMRACTKCPGGLTTAAAGSVRPQQCIAPTGSYYLAGKAVPCAQGTYKDFEGNADCQKCPDGFTTADGVVGAVSVTSCSKVLPGYEAAAGQGAAIAANFNATKCAADYYREGAVDYDNGAGVPCVSCGNSLQTLPNTAGATTKNMCLTPPGTGYSAASGGTATTCASGTFNAGWNREACSSCGSGAVSASGSTSSDACYTPAGYGASVNADGTMTVAICPADTYGRANPTYGIVNVPCEKCMDHTSTLTLTGQTGVAACLTDAGYGYDDGAVNQCDFGYWAAGNTTASCTYCGEGYTTDARGSVSSAACKISAGWESDGAGGIRPCPAGKYKALTGSSSCLACPTGTTTTVTMAATASSQCDACVPGYGGASCTQCGSGYWSGGGDGVADCTTCQQPAGYSGDMVSRPGSGSAEQCVPEFASDGGEATLMPFDIIPMTLAGLDTNAATTEAACQTACEGDTACQYFVFYNYTGALVGSPTTQCFLRSDGALTPITGDITASTNVVLFEAKTGLYAAYPLLTGETATTVGTTLTLTGAAASSATYANVKAFCDATPACIGMTRASGDWRAFGGEKWEAAVGKVRFVGAALNSWTA